LLLRQTTIGVFALYTKFIKLILPLPFFFEIDLPSDEEPNIFPVKAVLDEILYLTSNSGIATITGKRLVEKTGYKIRTVRAAVKALKDSEQFVVAQTANGRAGAYIFIDKEHENYPLIMKDLIDVDVKPVVIETTHAHQNTLLDAPLENIETTSTTGIVDEKEQPNSFNSIKKDLKPKQELASNLYGQVCKEMNVVGKDESVTAVMRTVEKQKKILMALQTILH